MIRLGQIILASINKVVEAKNLSGRSVYTFYGKIPAIYKFRSAKYAVVLLASPHQYDYKNRSKYQITSTSEVESPF